MAKLAVRKDDVRRRRHLFIPLSHGGQFQRASSPFPLRLSTLFRDQLDYPFSLTYREQTRYRNLVDDVLPADVPLRADGIVDEHCVLVARIGEDDAVTATRESTDSTAPVNAEDAFYLPLRTRLTVCFGERLRRPVRQVLSCRNDLAEDISEETYSSLVGLTDLDYVIPQTKSSSGE